MILALFLRFRFRESSCHFIDSDLEYFKFNHSSKEVCFLYTCFWHGETRGGPMFDLDRIIRVTIFHFDSRRPDKLLKIVTNTSNKKKHYSLHTWVSGNPWVWPDLECILIEKRQKLEDSPLMLGVSYWRASDKAKGLFEQRKVCLRIFKSWIYLTWHFIWERMT